MCYHIFPFIAALFLLVTTLFAPAAPPVTAAESAKAAPAGRPWRFYGDLRYRYEVQDNFNAKYYGSQPPAGNGSDSFLLQRLRLGVHYRLTERVALAAGIQDSRAFGVGLPDNEFYKKPLGMINHPYEDDAEPYETWLIISDIGGRDLTLIAGRQSIHYGNNRIFGPGQWGNTGRYHWDAVRLSWHHGPHFVDALWGAHIIHEPEEISLAHRHNHYGGAVYGHYEVGDALVLEPFVISKYDHHETFKGENGTGGRIFGKLPAGGYYDATGVIEQGNYGADSIRAWGAHVKGGGRFASLPWTPDLSAEYSHASGDGNPTDGIHRNFAGVFGARDKMYGRINLFDWRNIEDAQLNIEVFPRKNISLLAEFHDFRLAEAKDGWSLNPSLYRDPTGAAGDDVGRELDLIATWNFRPSSTPLDDRITLMAGACRFRPGSFTKRVATDENADWLFLQMRYQVTY